MFRFLKIFFYLTLSSYAYSATIQFPKNELPSEYALPYFEKTRAVLNRNVTLKNRFIFHLAYARTLDEPLFTKNSFLGSIAFYWNESHGIGLSGIFFPIGASREVRIRVGEEGGENFYYPGFAPRPYAGGFINYQFAPLYGKLSISKTLAFNFSFYSFIGGGVLALQQYGDGRPLLMMPASHFGLGQKFYFNRWLALDAGVDFLIYKGLNPVHGCLKLDRRWQNGGQPISESWAGNVCDNPSALSSSSFKQDIFFRFLIRMGLTVLF